MTIYVRVELMGNTLADVRKFVEEASIMGIPDATQVWCNEHTIPAHGGVRAQATHDECEAHRARWTKSTS